MTKPIRISAIVAVDRNNVIGKDNKLIWHIPEDLKYFKKTTMGKPMVMGRKSYDAIGKPLPGRANIVISRSPGKAVDENGPFFVSSVKDGMALAKEKAIETAQDEIFIIGGGEIFRQTLDVTDRLYLTVIDKEYDGDAFFPNLNPHEWHTISKDHHEGDPPFTFFVLERKRI